MQRKILSRQETSPWASLFLPALSGSLNKWHTKDAWHIPHEATIDSGQGDVHTQAATLCTRWYAPVVPPPLLGAQSHWKSMQLKPLPSRLRAHWLPVSGGERVRGGGSLRRTWERDRRKQNENEIEEEEEGEKGNWRVKKGWNLNHNTHTHDLLSPNSFFFVYLH